MKYFSMKSMFRTLAMTSSMMLALPAFAQIDGEQVDSNPHAEFLSESGFAMENCDALAAPAQLKEVIDLATSKMSNNIIVCVLPGDSKQTLNLKYPGLRVIALQPGLTNLDVVYINSPTVLFGFNIGHLAIDKLAAGSVVAASSLSKAASLTTDVIFIGNKLIKGIDGPTGRISVAMHLPNYARGLNLARNNTPLSATQTGDNTVAGWLPRSVLSSSADTGNKERKNSNQFGQVNNAKDSKVNQPNPGYPRFNQLVRSDQARSSHFS